MFNVISPSNTRSDEPPDYVVAKFKTYIAENHTGDVSSLYVSRQPRKPFHFIRTNQWQGHVSFLDQTKHAIQPPKDFLIESHLLHFQVHELPMHSKPTPI